MGDPRDSRLMIASSGIRGTGEVAVVLVERERASADRARGGRGDSPVLLEESDNGGAIRGGDGAGAIDVE